MDANRISVSRTTLQRLLMSFLLVATAGSGFAAPPPPPPPPNPPGGAEDRDARIVTLIVDLSADGTVTAVTLEKSSGFPELDAAAMEAASGWHFNPLLKDGKPVAGKARVPVSFPPG
ncbi:MAG: energy transducer TonB [Pseudomonas sp.]|uniref:energy transducer TonB n=1 Tax=Stenotrophomonas sp. TaxID=69392 RepID=UPI003D6D0C3A